jgi:hypothetical protein
MTETELTPATILAEAARILAAAGYYIDRDTESKLSLPPERALLAEDKYGIVAVVVYDTWTDLAVSWAPAQAAIVGAVSDAYTRLDRKAWDGYLVLLTPAFPSAGDTTPQQIRYDISRIRKLVATGDDLRSISDISRTLAPLLPLALDTADIDESQSLLDELPSRLAEAGIPPDVAEIAVAAFRDQRPIVEELHRHLEAT